MKRVFTSEVLAEAAHLRNLLEQQGIRCTIRNEQLSGALGELSFLDCLPEVWVLDDDDLERALEIVARQRRPAASGPAWRCRACGESNEGQFAACWHCGASDA